MGMKFIKRIPTAEEIIERLPVSAEIKRLRDQRVVEIKKILSGEDSRFLLIIGPCSADHEDPVCDYISRLAEVQEKVKDQLLIVPRIYTNKPRTTGKVIKVWFISLIQKKRLI